MQETAFSFSDKKMSSEALVNATYLGTRRYLDGKADRLPAEHSYNVLKYRDDWLTDYDVFALQDI